MNPSNRDAGPDGSRAGDPGKRQYKKWSIYVNSMMEPGGKWGIKRIHKKDTGRNPSTNFGNLSPGI
jgi:hypothetical protein